MGLDQYAFSRDGNDDDGKVEIMYWRKHANLEGWMANLYHARGGKGDFNCVNLQLFRKDIERLEREYLDLDTAEGFFWGQSYPEHNSDTLSFISLAYEAIDSGRQVIYTSWW